MRKSKDIREAVETELAFDPLVDSSDVSVKNLEGEVGLVGTVPNYLQYVDAAAAARRVAGVANVHNHLAVSLPPGDYRDDATLTTMANNVLQLDVAVPARVEAMARSGNLTLTGTVSIGSQRVAAADAVAGLVGVRNIKNEIEIINDADPIYVTLNVQNALVRYSPISDDSDVRVDTNGNTVTLTGQVRTLAEHNAVIDATWTTPGVFDVFDELVITG
jgi:osmotically-inducible protein OsmY